MRSKWCIGLLLFISLLQGLFIFLLCKDTINCMKYQIEIFGFQLVSSVYFSISIAIVILIIPATMLVHEMGHIYAGRIVYGCTIHGGIRLRIFFTKNTRTLVFPLQTPFRPEFQTPLPSEINRALLCAVNMLDDNLVLANPKKYALVFAAGPLVIFFIAIMLMVTSELFIGFISPYNIVLRPIALNFMISSLMDTYPFFCFSGVSDGMWISYLMNGKTPPGTLRGLKNSRPGEPKPSATQGPSGP